MILRNVVTTEAQHRRRGEIPGISLISPLISPLLSSLVGWEPVRPGAAQLNLTVNAERARGRQEIGSRL